MHSSASRAANGMSSAKRACEEPNRSFISEARKEPRASAANWGNVIMHALKVCCPLIVDKWWGVNSPATTTAIPAGGAEVRRVASERRDECQNGVTQSSGDVRRTTALTS